MRRIRPHRPVACPAAPRRRVRFAVGTGQNPGVAMDGVGTAYVGWQIDTYEPGDAVQFCRLPPRQRAAGR